MPRVTEEYREARRDEIARAAMVAFRRKGFQAASMADIIAESGLSAGAIYGHFASKADIILEVATKVIGSRIEEIEQLTAVRPLPPPARLVRVLMTGMLHDIGRPTMLVQLWGEAVTDPAIRGLAVDVLDGLRRAYSQYISLWHQTEHKLPAEKADAVAATQAPLFVAAAQGYILQSAILPDFDGEAFLATIEEFLPR